MQGLSVRTKVFFLFAGAGLLTVVPVLVLIARAVEQRVYERATEEMIGASASLASNWRETGDRLQETARRLASDREVERLIRAGDGEPLRKMLVRKVGRGQVVLAADSLGNPLAGPALDSTTLNRGGSIVLFPPGDSVPLRVAVWPVFMDTEPAQPPLVKDSLTAEPHDVELADSVQIGVVGVGEPLHREAIDTLKTRSGGADVALLAGDPVTVISGTLPDTTTRFLGGRSMRLLVERSAVRPQRAERLLYVVIPLPAVDRPAAVALFRGVEEELRLAGGIERSVIGIGLAALVLALLLALLVSRIVARPAQALAAAATDLAQGNFDTPLPSPSGDEIGQLTRAFREMRSAIAQREARLRSAQAELINREKLAAMGRLVAQLSHEINNPIYNIQNCLEVLDRRTDPKDPNREFLSLAREELQRMAGLTRQMLDQSRPVSNAARPIDINQMIQRVATLADAELSAHGIQPTLRLEPGIPLVVAHPDALQQVLANLVDNAVDAMPAGGRLTVTTSVNTEAVEVVVEDTGTGIAPEHLPHIFEAFYTTKPGISGIGLGLFVSEGIIRGHRGRLLVESRVGEGSRFVVQLPRETLDAALTPSESRPAEPATV